MADVLFRFQLHTTEAAKLEAEVTKAQNTITAAQQLISQLDGEHIRWNSQVGRSVCLMHVRSTLGVREQLLLYMNP